MGWMSVSKGVSDMPGRNSVVVVTVGDLCVAVGTCLHLGLSKPFAET